MARGKELDPAVKAAVMAALLTGQGVMQVSRDYKLPKQTVSRIKLELTPEQLGQLGTEKKERLDDLLLTCVAANVKALTKIAETSSEPDYIRTQPAESVGMLYGILADKAVRFLEAASNPTEGPGVVRDAGAGSSPEGQPVAGGAG